LEFKNKVMTQHELYKADIIFEGQVYPDKAFFPSSWPREKVIEKIYEAYDNFKENGANAILDNKKYCIRGITKEGIVIEMHFLPSSAELKTAYPIMRIK